VKDWSRYAEMYQVEKSLAKQIDGDLIKEMT